MSKVHRDVVVEDDKLKAELLAKEEVIKQIDDIQDEIKELTKKREPLAKLRAEHQANVTEMSEPHMENIEIGEGETVTSVYVENNKLNFRITDNALFLKEIAQKRVDETWEDYERQLEELNNKDKEDGNK